VKIIEYRIYLEQPLLATALQGDPNSSVSFDYVPGSQVRGLLINRYIERNGLQGSDIAGNVDCRRLFFDDRTRYLHAYLLSQNERRCLPTPLALLRRRSDDLAQAYNAGHANWDDEAWHDAEGDDQLQPLGLPFCVQNDDGSLTLYKPEPNTVSIHVLRERRKGRATPDQGAVFQYDALSPGQWFAGAILADLDTDAATLQDLLKPPTAWIGRSRSAEYGRVRIELLPERSGSWREVGGSAPSSLGQHATITLLSDTILRDGNGAVVINLTNDILSAYLGAPVTIKAYHSYSAGTYQGGFNRTWELPIIQTLALQTGSVIAFTAHSTINTSDLEQRGIGDRRSEGLGRIAFNWIGEMELAVSMGSCYQPTTNVVSSTPLSPVAQTLAQRMAKQLLATQIEQGILVFVRDRPLTNPPRNSQLARVRVLIRRAMRAGAQLAIVRSGLQTFKDAAHQQFQAARIEGRSLWDWLGSMLAEPAQDSQDQALLSYEDVWKKIKPFDSLLSDRWPDITVAGTPVHHNAQLSRTTALRLIDAVLAEAARANKRTAFAAASQPEEAHV
jgi:CRISPR-associated protein Csx10